MIIPEIMVITKPISPKYRYVTSYIARWSEESFLKIDISNNVMTSNSKQFSVLLADILLVFIKI